MAEQPAMLSERAKLRLRLAAGLLRGGDKGSRGGRDLGFSRENFYADIQKYLASLPLEEQNELRTLVDWLEGYESAGEGGSVDRR